MLRTVKILALFLTCALVVAGNCLEAQELKGRWKFRSFRTDMSLFWGDKNLTFLEWAPMGELSMVKEPESKGDFEAVLKFNSGGPPLAVSGKIADEVFTATAKVLPNALAVLAKDTTDKGNMIHDYLAKVEFKLSGRVVPATPSDPKSPKVIRGSVVNTGNDLAKPGDVPQPIGTVGLFSLEQIK